MRRGRVSRLRAASPRSMDMSQIITCGMPLSKRFQTGEATRTTRRASPATRQGAPPRWCGDNVGARVVCAIDRVRPGASQVKERALCHHLIGGHLKLSASLHCIGGPSSRTFARMLLSWTQIVPDRPGGRSSQRAASDRFNAAAGPRGIRCTPPRPRAQRIVLAQVARSQPPAVEFLPLDILPAISESFCARPIGTTTTPSSSATMMSLGKTSTLAQAMGTLLDEIDEEADRDGQLRRRMRKDHRR